MWNKKQNNRNGSDDTTMPPEPEITCGQRSPEDISRFLDNDLPSNEAVRFASHLRGCLACRTHFEAMRAQRAMLNALPTPAGSAAARARVLARFEAAALPAIAPPQPARPLLPKWAFPITALAGAVAALTITFLNNGANRPFAPASNAAKTAPVAATAPTPLPLPETEELTALFALHDTRSGALAAQDAPPHAAHAGATPASGPHGGTAQASARPSPLGLHGHTGTATAVVTPDPLNPDDIPEAL